MESGGPVATLVHINFDIQPGPPPPGQSRVAARIVEVPRDILRDPPDIWADARTIGAGVQSPRLIREIRPSYTPDAMRAKVMGTVTMDVVVKTDGTVGAVRVTKSLDREFGLDREALIAARYWLFEPGRVNGAAVPVKVVLELEFRLH
jgi:protein TonB